MANRPGIYKILNVLNGKSYVGSSQDVQKRLSVHAWLLRKGDHHSPQLQRSWNRDGEKAFVFTVIERCAKDVLIKREQIWINYLQSYIDRFGYNVGPVAGSREGVPQPLTHVERMRLLHTGVPKSAEHRAKIGVGNRGKVRSEATKAALRAIATLQFATPEARVRAGEYGRLAGSPFKGRVHSVESLALMSQKARSRWVGVPRKPKWKRPSNARPKEFHKKTGPKPGTPRPEKRNLLPHQVMEIRAARASGMSYGNMEKIFGVRRGDLHRIVTRKTYADI